MRKATASESYMYYNMYWLGIGLFMFVPFLNNFLIAIVKLYVSGDIAYTNLANQLQFVTNVLSMLSIYGGIGVLCCILVHFYKDGKSIIKYAILFYVVTFICALSATALYYPDSSTIFEGFFVFGIDMLAGIAVYLLIVFVIMRISKKIEDRRKIPKSIPMFGTKHPLVRAILYSILIYNGAQIIAEIKYMIDCFVDPSLGLPMNFDDVIFWVTEYLLIIVYGAIGYMIALSTAFLATHYLKYKPKALEAKPLTELANEKTAEN